MFKTILVGSDGSDHAQRAVEVAAQLASAMGSQVILAHAARPFPMPLAAAGGYVPYVPQAIIDESREQIRERVETEFAAPLRRAGVHYETLVSETPAADALCQAASDVGADLIVIGTRAMNVLGEVFIGSTSHGVLLHATVPVLVVPPPASKERKARLDESLPITA